MHTEPVYQNLFELSIEVPQITFSEPENFNRRYSLEQEKEVPPRNLLKEHYQTIFHNDVRSVSINPERRSIEIELNANLHDNSFSVFKLLDDIYKNGQKINITIKNHSRDGTIFYARTFNGAMLTNEFRNIFNSLSYESHLQFDMLLNVNFIYDSYQENIL